MTAQTETHEIVVKINTYERSMAEKPNLWDQQTVRKFAEIICGKDVEIWTFQTEHGRSWQFGETGMWKIRKNPVNEDFIIVLPAKVEVKYQEMLKKHIIRALNIERFNN